jgi:hypothetical protein
MYNHSRLAFGEMSDLDAFSDDGRADGSTNSCFQRLLAPTRLAGCVTPGA